MFQSERERRSNVQHNIHRDEHVDTDVQQHQDGDTEVKFRLKIFPQSAKINIKYSICFSKNAQGRSYKIFKVTTVTKTIKRTKVHEIRETYSDYQAQQSSQQQSSQQQSTPRVSLPNKKFYS